MSEPCSCHTSAPTQQDANTIVVCMGSSCFARGNHAHLRLIEAFLKDHNVGVRVQLRGSRCEEMCEHGPNVWIGNVLYQRVDKGVLIDALERRFGGRATETFREP